MKTDMEILHEYIDKYDKEFYGKLSFMEQILYQCQVRNTLSFSFYLLRHKISEFLNAFVKKKENKKQNDEKRMQPALLHKQGNKNVGKRIGQN